MYLETFVSKTVFCSRHMLACLSAFFFPALLCTRYRFFFAAACFGVIYALLFLSLFLFFPLTGQIPPTLSRLSRLKCLILSDNKLEGDMQRQTDRQIDGQAGRQTRPKREQIFHHAAFAFVSQGNKTIK